MNRCDVATRRRTTRYQCDTYYVQTRDVLTQLHIDADEFAWRHAVLLLKPDAAVTGGMGRAVAWLEANGYRIVGATAVALTPLHVRALWYFNWHKATPHRRRLADQLAGLSQSIVLIVTHPDDDVPVSVRLTADKGPADPAQREPGQLRHALASGTYLLNQVHSPDDPDDVLRELSIYFDEAQLPAVLSACMGEVEAGADAARLATRIESGCVRGSVDIAEAQDAIWEDLQAAGVTSRPRTGPDWIAALAVADGQHLVVDQWYRIVLEAACLPMHRNPSGG